MRLSLPWRRKSDDKPKLLPEERSEPKIAIDFSKPRESILLQLKGKPGPCPRCGGTLQQTYATYLIGTRRGSKLTDSFMSGAEFGWFCLNCPVVVLDENEVKKTLEILGGRWDIGTEFNVAGIVDLDAVPEKKRSLSFDDDNNPIPLVPFLEPGEPRQAAAKRHRKQKKRRRR
jgi:hypothetical protein